MGIAEDKEIEHVKLDIARLQSHVKSEQGNQQRIHDEIFKILRGQDGQGGIVVKVDRIIQAQAEAKQQKDEERKHRQYIWAALIVFAVEQILVHLIK